MWVARVLLLLPSATYRAPDFLDAARALGVEVVVATDGGAVLDAMSGRRALAVPFDRPDEAVAAIVASDAAAPLDAVVAVDDVGGVIAARAGQELGLPHNPPDAVAAARDKLTMRVRLAAAEVSQPAFVALAAHPRPEDVSAACAAVGLPCVIKPSTLSGSQGVLRADTDTDAVAVVRRVRAIADAAGVDPDAPLLVEAFVPGPEVAVEGLLVDGELHVLALFDKPDPLDGPAFEETIYVTPSRLDDAARTAVTAAVDGATRALGLVDGPVHAEARVQGTRVAIIEVAARTIGGLCSRTLAFSTGHTLEALVIRRALGMEVGQLDVVGASGVLMVPIPRAGTLVEVRGQSEARAVPGVTGVEITVARGRTVTPVPEGNRYLGFVLARDVTPERVERALRRAWSLLDVVVTDGPAG